jgi:energy-coupling factor transport system permease protein
MRVNADPLLTRLNPVFKLAALLLLTVALSLVFDPVTPGVFLLLAVLAGHFLGGVRLRTFARFLAPFLVAVVGVFLANILFNRHNATSPAIGYLGPFKITQPALTIAASISLRLLAFASLSLVFVSTTDPGDLILSLVQQVRLNYRVAFGVMVGYRMLPLLSGEYALIKAAHRVRGVREGSGLRDRVVRLRRYAVPLLAGAVRRAGRVALAMDARSFGAFPSRTYRRRIEVALRDWVFLGTVVVLALGVVLGLWAAGIAHFGVGV